MGIFDKFKAKKGQKEVLPKKSEVSSQVPAPKSLPQAEGVAKKEVKKVTKAGELRGKTDLAYRILVKPLITEKASDIGSLNKYIFAVSPKTNKVEIKKAIRSVYNVDPIKINISNFSGKKVRYGRIQGVTKGWKKAVVTLKPGDKIEVYEGV